MRAPAGLFLARFGFSRPALSGFPGDRGREEDYGREIRRGGRLVVVLRAMRSLLVAVLVVTVWGDLEDGRSGVSAEILIELWAWPGHTTRTRWSCRRGRP